MAEALFYALIIIKDSGVTSYCGDETIDCVGMQPIVEPALGLCDNLKPNRFLGAERKRFSRILHQQILYFFHIKRMITYEFTATICFSMERNN